MNQQIEVSPSQRKLLKLRYSARRNWGKAAIFPVFYEERYPRNNKEKYSKDLEWSTALFKLCKEKDPYQQYGDRKKTQNNPPLPSVELNKVITRDKI